MQEKKVAIQIFPLSNIGIIGMEENARKKVAIQIFPLSNIGMEEGARKKVAIQIFPPFCFFSNTCMEEVQEKE